MKKRRPEGTFPLACFAFWGRRFYLCPEFVPNLFAVSAARMASVPDEYPTLHNFAKRSALAGLPAFES